MNICRFFRTVYEDNADRKLDDRRSMVKDVVRYLANRFVQPIDRLLVRMYRDSCVPIVFIVGVPRSGSTLLYQLICEHLDVGYVSNAMARWWMAPVAAARFRSPVHGKPLSQDLASDLGRTEGPDGPHEFGWFWQFHLFHEGTDDLDPEVLADLDFRKARAELEGLAGYFGRTLVLKAIAHTPYKIAWLKAHLPQARFIWIHRDPIFVGQSILESRERRFADSSRWWSIRPRDVEEWKSRTPYEQIAHQIMDVTAAIGRAFASLDLNDGLHVYYDQLVRHPDVEIRRIAQFCGADVRSGRALSSLRLKSQDRPRLPPDALGALVRALVTSEQ